MRSICWDGDFPITQAYGPPGHTGIDIGCPTGTPIYAARAGVVERIQQGLVSIRVGTQRDFYLHGYPKVSVGQSVAQRALVITSDTVTVDSRYPLTGPHLHFEIQNGYVLPGAPPAAIGAPLDPGPVLSQPWPPAPTPAEEDDNMLYIGPRHDKAATLRAFQPCAVKSDPSASARDVGSLALNATAAFDYFVYTSSTVQSPDTSGSAGNQPGPDNVWWHKAGGGWVSDAYLDTSKLAGAPAIAIPAGEPLALYFALAGAAAPDDDSAFATKKELADAIATLPKPPTKVSIPGPLTGDLS